MQIKICDYKFKLLWSWHTPSFFYSYSPSPQIPSLVQMYPTPMINFTQVTHPFTQEVYCSWTPTLLKLQPNKFRSDSIYSMSLFPSLLLRPIK